MASAVYSREAEAILKEARNLAKSSSQPTSSAHLLLALFTVPNQAQHYLKEHAIDEDALLARLSRLENEASGIVEAILRRAERTAEGAGTGPVTSLHLLSALMGFKDGVGYHLLEQVGSNMAHLRNVAMSFILAREMPKRFRVAPAPDGPHVQAETARMGTDAIKGPGPTIAFHPGLQVDRRPERSTPGPATSQAGDGKLTGTTGPPREPGHGFRPSRGQEPGQSEGTTGQRGPKSDEKTPYGHAPGRSGGSHPGADPTGIDPSKMNQGLIQRDRFPGPSGSSGGDSPQRPAVPGAERQKAGTQSKPRKGSPTKRNTDDSANLAQRLFGSVGSKDKLAGRPDRTDGLASLQGFLDGGVDRGARKPSNPLPNSTGQDERARAFELAPEEFPTLTQYGKNLTAQAAKGAIDAVIGRDAEIWQLVDILNKRRSNNPILVGDPGVGKTAIAEGLALLLASPEPPGGLGGRVIVELDAGRLFSGTGLRGSLAERLIALKEEVERAQGRVIVLLDEIHRWIAPGAGSDGPDGAGELKPALARGSFPCIGTTTYDEYRHSIASDPAFNRRFQMVRVEEPSIDQTVVILQGVRDKYAQHHGVTFSDDALKAAARLSHRYISDRCNPDKALGILDLAGSKARRQGLASVEENVVAEVVGEISGIPPSKLLMSDRERFLTMEEVLMKAIVGHERSLSRIAHVLRRNYAGFATGRPIGSFLFLGPTGVGKTETAKVLADFLFQSREAITTLDMSEFAESHSVARLIGSPPGYVGFDSGGQLTEAVRRYPYQIVLFDEIEKASPSVLNLLLQILEEGRLTDSRGQVVDFTNTVIVMTSNLGGQEATEVQAAVGFGRQGSTSSDHGDRVIEAARKALPPELYNRIDEPMVFEPLSRPQVERIAFLQLQRSSQRLLDDKGIAFSVTQAVVDYLIGHGGFDAKLGARPLRRAIERYVEGPIADLILRGEITSPAEIQVEVEGEELVFEVT